MKGILLAGGSGTRLYPATNVVTKQLLQIYDKPMIYHPLSTLMLAGIRDIQIISSPRDLPNIRNLLGDGHIWGISLTYKVQERPTGIAEALILAEEFLDGHSSCLILGDNLFYGHGFGTALSKISINERAKVFGYRVQDPSSYGVVVLDKSMKPLRLVEKPTVKVSNYAIPGLYFYPADAPALARELPRSERGELEITALNQEYLNQDRLDVDIIERSVAWLDTGTPDDLLSASNFVQNIEKRQGTKIACLEEVALQKGFISVSELLKLVSNMPNNQYAAYLSDLAESF